MYYQDREGGVPVEWMRRVKQSLMHLSHQFNSGRMVGRVYVATCTNPPTRLIWRCRTIASSRPGSSQLEPAGPAGMG
jgi:hypothetical protein